MTQSDLSGRRVLVVEDEPRIAMLIRDTLEDLGCQVVAIASRLQEACAKAATLEFDVALLDVDLKGEPSYPLANELVARGVPFVLATGYGAPAIPADLKDVPVLQKPFLRAELERMLRLSLDR
jgi:CheY-like chemotaxis protein